MAGSETLGLSRKELLAARNAARGGQYQILLGAGSSVGATNSHGAIPLARDLAGILMKRYPKAPIAETDSLHRAYQRAVLVSSPEHVWRTFSEVFGGAHHESWFQVFASLPWRRVWTLNVDDTFENAYRDKWGEEKRKLRSISWDEPYIETGDLEIIHLHGHIIGSVPQKLVFSFSEYQAAASAKPVWNQVLAGLLGVESFVVLGASILNDPDVEALLLGNRPTSQAPSFIVDPYIGDGNRWELEQLGYRVIKLTGEQFLSAWQTEMDLDEESVRDLEESESLSVPQFTKLQTNRTTPPPRSHDYFGGDAPVWADIIERLPARFGWMADVVAHIKEWVDAGATAPMLHVIYGHRMSGVSSGLLMIARSSIDMYVDVFWFDKSSRFNVPTVLRSRAHKRPAVIFIDTGADFASDVDKLLRDAATSDTSLYLVVSESPQNDLRLEGRLGGGYDKYITKAPHKMSRNDAIALVEKLDNFGRLGSLELEKPALRTRHFRNRDVFSSLMEVEHAIGFRKRLEGEVTALDAPWKKDLLLLLSIAAQGAREVGVMEAAIAVGRASDGMLREITEDEHSSAVIEVFESKLVARQREHGISALVGKMGTNEAIGRLREMITNLAPLATRASLQQRNRPVQLVGYLMTARQLQQNFANIDLDRDFYELLRSLFGDWNGRYWEQRAIYSKSQGDWSKAESFAARAVGLYDDAFTRTTYGTILINKAASFGRLESTTWQSFYDRGRSEFDAAAQKEPGNKVTVFAYLSAALELAKAVVPWERAAKDESSGEALQGLREDWQNRYAALRISLPGVSNFETARRLEVLSTQWAALWAV